MSNFYTCFIFAKKIEYPTQLKFTMTVEKKRRFRALKTTQNKVTLCNLLPQDDIQKVVYNCSFEYDINEDGNIKANFDFAFDGLDIEEIYPTPIACYYQEKIKELENYDILKKTLIILDNSKRMISNNSLDYQLKGKMTKNGFSTSSFNLMTIDYKKDYSSHEIYNSPCSIVISKNLDYDFSCHTKENTIIELEGSCVDSEKSILVVNFLSGEPHIITSVIPDNKNYNVKPKEKKGLKLVIIIVIIVVSIIAVLAAILAFYLKCKKPKEDKPQDNIEQTQQSEQKVIKDISPTLSSIE